MTRLLLFLFAGQFDSSLGFCLATHNWNDPATTAWRGATIGPASPPKRAPNASSRPRIRPV
jgi:hypothetical protein